MTKELFYQLTHLALVLCIVVLLLCTKLDFRGYLFDTFVELPIQVCVYADAVNTKSCIVMYHKYQLQINKVNKRDKSRQQQVSLRQHHLLYAGIY